MITSHVFLLVCPPFLISQRVFDGFTASTHGLFAVCLQSVGLKASAACCEYSFCVSDLNSFASQSQKHPGWWKDAHGTNVALKWIAPVMGRISVRAVKSCRLPSCLTSCWGASAEFPPLLMIHLHLHTLSSPCRLMMVHCLWRCLFPAAHNSVMEGDETVYHVP